ncbi:50S ribosomal protein L19 [Candidatus Gracilibacteria bacterium]|nr:50S ribosomal protein L19 [Candidatus Gracilibacteria bacterium]
MNLLQHVQELAGKKKKVPLIRTGMTVRVHLRIKEGEKQRTQIFEGLVLKVNSGHGADKSYTVRKMVGGIGVEKIFPLHSTNIEKIEVKKIAKVRRSKLYYMRERSGKSARLRQSLVSGVAMDETISLEEEEEKPEVAETPEENTDAQEDAPVAETPETPEAPEAPATPEVAETPEAPEAEETKPEEKE